MSEDKSRSPPRLSISSQISAMGTRLGRALSKDGRQGQTQTDPTNTNSRSVSRGRDSFASSGRGGLVNTDDVIGGDAPRGREALISTGRGGAGNIVRSPSRDIEPESHGHINSANIAAKAFSTGRGGAGNIRPTSCDPHDGTENPQTSFISPEQAEYEREVLQRHVDAREDVHVTGRGGLGNISTSRSRSRSKGPALHSSGRGGAGNIWHGLGDHEAAEIMDEQERLKHPHPDGIHSTGRGGLANVTSAHGPGIEKVQHLGDHFESSGRGGAGNIRSRSVSREPGSRNPSKEKHGVSQLWNKVIHGHPHGHTPDPDAIQEASGKEEGE